MLGSALWRRGLRYRRRSGLPGKPDFVFVRAKVVVFVDGDFWHGRGLDARIARGQLRARGDYWIPKLRRNAERDVEVTAQLSSQGWQVFRVWESELLKRFGATVDAVESLVRGRQASPASPSCGYRS